MSAAAESFLDGRMTLTYGSVCSGIEAASVAWEPLGWKPKFFAEIEKFPSAVLAERFGSNMPGAPLPGDNGVPNLGDFTKIGPEWGPVDLLVGGTPCQSFSVAGRRLGLDDPRGNLALEFLALARRLSARWIVWENVPGVLSSKSGACESDGDDGGECGGSSDFATFLGFVRECGYSGVWRVLDAQYVRTQSFPVAVPQRRRRVFLVGHIGDWRGPASVFLDPESLRWDPPPRRQARQGVADGFADGSGASGEPGGNETQNLIAVPVADTLFVGANQTTGVATEVVAHALRGEGFDASEDGTGRGTPIVAFGWQNSASQGASVSEHISPTLDKSKTPAIAQTVALRGRDGGGQMAVAIQGTVIGRHDGAGPAGSGVDESGAMFTLTKSDQHAIAHAFRPSIGRKGGGDMGDIVHTLSAQAGSTGKGDTAPAVALSDGDRWIVRRLTPRECERLQGFPDDHTLIPWRGKPASECPDGPRYKAIGNSMAVNVMEWVGRRIALYERLRAEGELSP